MRKADVVFFIFLAAVMCSACPAGEENVVYVSQSEKWTLNNWKKEQKAELEEVEEKSPDGASAIRIKFLSTEGGCQANSTILPEQSEWRKQEYYGVAVWVKSLGATDGRKINFRAITKDAAYTWTVRLESAEWQLVRLPLEGSYSKEGGRKDLHETRFFGVSSAVEADFMVGGIGLIPRAEETLAFAPVPTFLAKNDAANKIVVDGKLDDPVWQNAPRLSLIGIKGKALNLPTTVQIASDGENLLVSARMQCADTGKLIADKRQHDSQVWQDDCLEVLVDASLDGKSYVHFIVNSIGTKQDYRYRFDAAADSFIFDKENWNPEWAQASQFTPTEWTMELSIPLADAGISPELPFALQIGRENNSDKEYAALSETDRFISIHKFPVFRFAEKKSEAKAEKLSLKPDGSACLDAVFPAAGKYDLAWSMADPYGKLAQGNCAVEAGENLTGQIPFTISPKVDGVYRLVVSGGGAGEIFLAGSFELKLPPAITYGDLFLNPRPKTIEVNEEEVFSITPELPLRVKADASDRTLQTARFLRAELRDNLGVFLPLLKGEGEGKAVSLSLLDRNDAEAKGLFGREEIPAEGYVVVASPEGISIRGVDEAGLYYGVVTFMQYCRNCLLKNGEGVFKAVKIVDWPDRQFRIISHWAGAKSRRLECRQDPEALKKWLKEYVAGNKYNYWSLLLNESYEYDRRSEVSSPQAMLTRKQYREIVAFAREHFIQVIPALQSGGHSQHFTKPYPFLREENYNHDQANVEHPEFHNILFDCYDDILDAYEVKPEYLMIWHDEWWHKTEGDPAPTLNGKERWQVFRDNLLKIHGHLAKRGVKIMMFCDMLLPEHNGGYPFHVSKALEGLPRDIMMLNWSCSVAPSAVKYLTDNGFKVISVTNNYKELREKDKPLLSGSGIILYGHFLQTFWYSRDGILANYVHSIFPAADQAWNHDRQVSLPLGEWRRSYLQHVNALFNLPPRGTAKTVFKPLDMKTGFNETASALMNGLAPRLEPGAQEIAYFPFELAASGGADVLAAKDGNTYYAIDCGKLKASSLVFLQGAYLDKKEREEFKKESMNYLHGVPVGEIIIEVEHGPSQRIELRLGLNTNEIHPIPDERYLLGARFNYDCKTVSGKDASLYLLEWANPWPDRPITRIVLKSYGTAAIPLIYALSAAK
jgi:hypothetical protein